MKQIKIDLREPFEKTLAAVLSLPKGSHAGAEDETVEQALRFLYTAAHGRAVQTSIGPISIAPPIDSSLKGTLLPLATRTDLLQLTQCKTEFRGRSPESPSPLGATTAFSDFMAGRLGAAGCWPLPATSTKAPQRARTRFH